MPSLLYMRRMNLSSASIGRHMRLALLLLLLAAQGSVSAHELGSTHSLDSHLCSICLTGHGLAGAVNVHADVPQVQIAQTALSTPSIADVLVSRGHYYFTRAPPGSLCSAQKRN